MSNKTLTISTALPIRTDLTDEEMVELNKVQEKYSAENLETCIACMYEKPKRHFEWVDSFNGRGEDITGDRISLPEHVCGECHANMQKTKKYAGRTLHEWIRVLIDKGLRNCPDGRARMIEMQEQNGHTVAVEDGGNTITIK